MKKGAVALDAWSVVWPQQVSDSRRRNSPVKKIRNKIKQVANTQFIMKIALFRNLLVACAPSGGAPLLRPSTSLSTLYKVLALTIAILAQNAPAQTWQTVDDFQYTAGMSAGNY